MAKNVNESKSKLEGIKELYYDFKSIGNLMYYTLANWQNIYIGFNVTLSKWMNNNSTFGTVKALELGRLISVAKRKIYFEFYYGNNAVFKHISDTIVFAKKWNEYLKDRTDDMYASYMKDTVFKCIKYIMQDVISWYIANDVLLYNISGSDINGKLIGFDCNSVRFIVKSVVNGSQHLLNANEFTFGAGERNHLLGLVG